ncbi:hypothetical protein FZEAL_10836 [Fusarium zealandicum]|uniref:Alpha/beta hydrolase fold-3 domain-containing protein n=1 Tax=Fusarium zealandicum TaxID=1053134 RepID=A0A8H4X7G5_9HYPO|nr:hypothetical protein FZEAL_10836 [Fusarium zealandicum]
MQYKLRPEYVDLDVDFKPLPKHGHLSQKHPAFLASEAAINAAFQSLYDAPDHPALRKLAGTADAAIPPGGPDRDRDIITQLLCFPARDGSMIELKVYKSPRVVQDATLMYRIHGGGWTVGHHEIDGAENVHAAANTNIVVVSVDYRLAPEHPFPQPLHDCYDGLVWCKENAKSLGVDPEKIILGGGSAGASLAAVLALEAREHGITGIIAQVLHFPAVCHPKFFPREIYEFGSYVQNSDNGILSTLMMESAWDWHTPHAESDYRHSPLLAESLQNLPPACFDVLRDDAFAYSEALEAAGVEVEVYSYSGLPHFFHTMLMDIPETSSFYHKFNAFLEKYSGNKTSVV